MVWQLQRRSRIQACSGRGSSSSAKRTPPKSGESTTVGCPKQLAVYVVHVRGRMYVCMYFITSYLLLRSCTCAANTWEMKMAAGSQAILAHPVRTSRTPWLGHVTIVEAPFTGGSVK